MDLPALSETVLNMFAVYSNQVPENDDIRNETDDLKIVPGSQYMPNKPTAIVKPCHDNRT